MGRGTLMNMVAFLREKRKSPCSSSEGAQRGMEGYQVAVKTKLSLGGKKKNPSCYNTNCTTVGFFLAVKEPET